MSRCRHILAGELVDACGYCGCTDTGCEIFMSDKRKRQQRERDPLVVAAAQPKEIMKGTNGETVKACKSDMFYKFAMASAAKFSMSSPCTNRPVDCLLCTGEGPKWQWSYNLAAHLEAKHSTVKDTDETMQKMKELAAVSYDERGQIAREFNIDKFEKLVRATRIRRDEADQLAKARAT